MKIEAGQKYLITASDWFFAPDGEQYRAVWGTVKAVRTDADALGVQTNRHSTNWYLEIGNMLMAGCQIKYAVRCDSYSPIPPTREIDHEGRASFARASMTRIFNADNTRFLQQPEAEQE